MMSSAALFFMTTFITLSCYFIGLRLFQKFNKSWLNPLYSSTVLIITLLNFLHIDVKSYTSGSGIFTAMLGTATVSLAIPLYKQYDTIKKYLSIIAFAVIPGTLIGVVSVVLLTKLLHLNHEIMSSMIPKSVTAPIALTISQAMGGIPSLTFLFIIISAVFSITTGPFLLKCTRIRSRIAKGLALGTSAQAIGASRAFEWGELEGTMGSIAMISSALTLSLITPFLINFFLF
jgi:predicted murein hydrolase (TIGR00659 family)